MLERAGFHNHSRHHEIDLAGTMGCVTPAFFFDDPNGHYEGVCLFLQSSDSRTNALDELRRRFFEVIEIHFDDLADIEAMRAHFFRLARALFGRDSAARLREDASWFAPSSRPVDASDGDFGQPISTDLDHETNAAIASLENPIVSVDVWEECIELLDPAWHLLARGLRDAGVPSPTDVDWEIPICGRVGEKRAVMVWQQSDKYVALVESDPADSAEIAVSPTTDVSTVVAMLEQRLLAMNR